MDSPDKLIIDRLRKENIEQFYTLVRMHLSFVVDICIDDVDGTADKPPKQFRWNFNKKARSSTNNSSQSNIKDVRNEASSITEEGITRVYELIDFLSKIENVTQEGIFRRTGSLSRQQELRQLLLTGSSLTLDEGRFSVHDCASVLKGFLAELPQPLLMEHYYQTYCTLASQHPPSIEASEPKIMTALQLLLLLLSPIHREFLQRLLRLLKLAADHEASNRMSPDSLATMFTPHLLCPRKLSPETFHTEAIALAPLMSFMIRHSDSLFTAPKQLATDVSAYFTMRERKIMLSPDVPLDESISDRTAASTVYTFVDRQRTEQENAKNPTDTALAQLYAHIQALPESNHKRRLVKLFNRQNGYGTPIQVQRTGKAAGSRSFGDSIKRHIFNKGLLNKTPKKASGSSINSIEEKITNKLRNNDKIDVSHKSVVLKNLANKMATIDYDDPQSYDSDSSNESTMSDGALNTSKKLSPKFVSEPNLSLIDTKTEEETPKNTNKSSKRLFRTKMLSTHTLNKRYQKRGTVLKSTPTSCVPCLDDQETGSETELSLPETSAKAVSETPRECKSDETSKSETIDVLNDSAEDVKLNLKFNYLTSTPGFSEDMKFEECSTPYTFRRASMSPITKSTQKLSKAMQESIMTPRSRKPLIVTSLEQRDSLPESKPPINELSKHSEAYHSMTPKNDSDFVSSEDETPHSSSLTTSRPECSRFVTHDPRSLALTPNLTEFNQDHSQKSLTLPFREYLMSRSVLTATPVDLSILNKSTDSVDGKISDSLMFCLDGNMPNDLSLSVNSFVDHSDRASLRSPLKNLDSFVNIEACSSNRKRIGAKDVKDVDSKKALLEKENLVGSDAAFQLRETEL